VEAAEALGVRSTEAPAMMARRLAIRHGCTVVVTSAPLGLWWSHGSQVRRVPAVPIDVRDVCGAGDTVLATLGVETAENETIEGSCRLAVNTASQQVASTGGCDPCALASSVSLLGWGRPEYLGPAAQVPRVDVT